MRDFEPWLRDGLVPVEQQVEVERPRALPRGNTSVSAEDTLQLEEHLEQCAWRKSCLELHDPVQELRLVEKSNRIGVA
jgi:hypothetical protein